MNNMILLVTMLLSTAGLVVSAVWIVKHRKPLPQEMVAVVQETKTTALLGGLCILISYGLLFAKWFLPDTAGSRASSLWLVVLFSLLCMGAGIFTMLFTFVKKSIAYQDRLVQISFLGTTKEMLWSEVQQVKLPMMSRRVVFKTGDKSFRVYGEPKQYRKFVQAIRPLVSYEAGGGSIDSLLTRL